MLRSDPLADDARHAAPQASFVHYVPCRPLSDFVALFWYWRGHSSPRSTERVLPMPTMELVFRLGGGTPGGGISGPHSQAFFIDRGADDELLGVHFKPGGALPFLGVPAGDLHNRYAALADLWGGPDAARLAACLSEAPTIGAKFSILEHSLFRAARHPLARGPAAAYALRVFDSASSLRSSADVAAALGMSQRRFIAVFRDEIGLTPKLYCRIRRLRDLIERVADTAHVDWAAAATSCGYFDQSHFIHDFRAFTGLRPTEYLGLRIAGQLGHVRVPD